MRALPWLPLLVPSLHLSLAAQAPDSRPITAAELAARLRYLSSDHFEGRYPGTKGETLTTAYLIGQLDSFGVRPGADGGWLQPVRIVSHAPDSTSPNEARLTGRVSRALEHGRDVRFTSTSSRPEVAVTGELVFVGYGISAPMYHWDDLAGTDLRGKIAVALLGEPTSADDTVRFNGGRASRFSWTRAKQAELERRGAVGVLWVRPSRLLAPGLVNGQRRLEADAARTGLVVSGIIADSTLAAVLPPGSPGLAALLAQAAIPGFKPVPLGVDLSARFRSRPSVVITNNVIGVVPGQDDSLAGEHIVLSAHWDAFGIGRPVGVDSIYNGALDDGSGTTQLLALARHFAARPQKRSITILFTTAEEWGLLGAWGYVCGGPTPPERIVANLNIDDGRELYGRMRDVAPLGVELSTLGTTVATVAARAGLRVSPDPTPAEGFFLRADNYPFAVAGVPALYMSMGADAVGRPAGFVDSLLTDYLKVHYHQPSDEYDAVVVDIAGSHQMAEFVRDVVTAVAAAPARPEWLPGAEFARPRPIGVGSGAGAQPGREAACAGES